MHGIPFLAIVWMYSNSKWHGFIGRIPMDFERVNIRSTLQLGISRMNFDLYGVPEGTVGPYLGFN